MDYKFCSKIFVATVFLMAFFASNVHSAPPSEKTARFISSTKYSPEMFMPAEGNADDSRGPKAGGYGATAATFDIEVLKGEIKGGRWWIRGALTGTGELGAPAGTCANPFTGTDLLSFYIHYFARDWYMGSRFYHQYTTNCSLSDGPYGFNTDVGSWTDTVLNYYHNLHDSYQPGNPVVDSTLRSCPRGAICLRDYLAVYQPKPTVAVNEAFRSGSDLNISIDAANTVDKGSGWSNRMKLKYRYQITGPGGSPNPSQWSDWTFPDSSNPGFKESGAVLDDYRFYIPTTFFSGRIHIEVHNGFSSEYGLKDTGGTQSFPGGIPTTGDENDFNKHYTVKDFGPPPPPPNNSPSVTRADISEPDYCVSGPAATVNWDFFDSDGDPQSAYQVQIDNQGSFGSPEHDSGKISCSDCRSNFSGAGKLKFDRTYKARVKVWDSKDAVSEWFESRSWKTPKHAYPIINFSWTPQNPAGNETVQFTDAAIFSDGFPPADSRHKWKWTFGDGGASLLQNPKHAYLSEGVYSVNEMATDADGFSCILAKTIDVSESVPIIKEVPPNP